MLQLTNLEQLLSSNEGALTDHQEAFIESVKNMNDIFKKPTSKHSGAATSDEPVQQPLQKEKIKGELAEIDRELR